MSEIIEIFGHSFIDNGTEDIIICNRCNIKAFVEGYDEFYCFNQAMSKWFKLDITCDEYIIKNIIE